MGRIKTPFLACLQVIEALSRPHRLPTCRMFMLKGQTTMVKYSKRSGWPRNMKSSQVARLMRKILVDHTWPCAHGQ